MNFKTTYVLIALVLIVVGVFFWAVWQSPSTEGSNYVLPSMHDKVRPLDPNDVNRVEIQRTKPSEETFVFERDPESKRWRITSPRDYPGNNEAINDLVRQIYNATREKEAEKLTNLSQYGLEPANEVITLHKGDRLVRLNVGNVSPGSETAESTVIYVTSSDNPKEILSVRRRDLDKVLKGLADFRGRDLLSPSAGDIQAFTLTQRSKGKAAKGPIELRKGSDDRWTYAQPPYGDAQANGTDQPDKPPTNVQSIVSDLSALKVDSDKDFVADDAKDLGKYHLDPAKDDLLRIDVDRLEEIAGGSEGKKEKKTAKVALVVGIGKKEGDKYYSYLDEPTHKDIVKVSAKGVARLVQLLDKPDALRDRNLVELSNFRQPDAIDIKNSWGLLEFRRTSETQKPWRLWRDGKSYTVDDQSMQNLINQLKQPNQVESFPEASQKAQLGLDKPDVTVTLWADGLTGEEKKEEKTDAKKKDEKKKEEKKAVKPEPKDKSKPAFVLSFGYRKENSAAVERKRGGEKSGTLMMVPAKLLDQVREGPFAYFDKQLPPFNSDRFNATPNVTKLTLTREGTTYEISREDKAGAPWKIANPPEFAGRTADRGAVENILRELNNLRAVKIVEDKIPGQTKLNEWGLGNPRYKAVVSMTKDGKPKTFEYDFGKEADDKSGTYLRSSQQETISIVPNTVLTALDRELQDPVVLQFDVAKVQAIKMTGWIPLQKKLGSDQPYVLDIKRAKNGTDWEAVTPKSFKLDAGKLQRFLTELSHLRAIKFVSHKKKPTPDQELDVSQGALRIDITVSGEKEPLQLTVGKLNVGVAYLAVTNKLPGDIFDVRKDVFDGPKGEPVYFSGK